MTNIRCYALLNHPVFVTAVCYRPQPVLAHELQKVELLEVMREVKAEMPFRILAYVMLNDHFH
jgi:putative transposase